MSNYETYVNSFRNSDPGLFSRYSKVLDVLNNPNSVPEDIESGWGYLILIWPENTGRVEANAAEHALSIGRVDLLPRLINESRQPNLFLIKDKWGQTPMDAISLEHQKNPDFMHQLSIAEGTCVFSMFDPSVPMTHIDNQLYNPFAKKHGILYGLHP